MHGLAYSIDGLMAAMIADPNASFRYHGKPADSVRASNAAHEATLSVQNVQF